MSNIKNNLTRLAAIQALYQRTLFPELVDEEILIEFQCRYPGKVDWILFMELIKGTREKENYINDIIKNYLHSNINDVSIVNLAIIQLGIFELLQYTHIPHHIIIKAYIKQAVALGTNNGYALVNSLLDKYSKTQRSL